MQRMTADEYLATLCNTPHKGNKYHAERVAVDGVTFDSKREAKRWCELRILERAGQISDLRRQVPFQLMPPTMGERGVKYVADFCYEESGQKIAEDVKSVATKRRADYIMKRKLFKLIHSDWEFREVT